MDQVQQLYQNAPCTCDVLCRKCVAIVEGEVPVSTGRYIEVSLDTETPEGAKKVDALRAGFGACSDIEGMDGRFVLVRIYPGAALELP